MQFGAKRLFEDVTTTFFPGRRYAITGPNGAGKTTLMKILAGEMEPSLRYIKCNLPQTRILLVLRDILDAPATTIPAWTNRGCYNIVKWYYDDVLVLGSRQIFDVFAEYRFPEALRHKVHFCGYVAREKKKGQNLSAPAPYSDTSRYLSPTSCQNGNLRPLQSGRRLPSRFL